MIFPFLLVVGALTALAVTSGRSSSPPAPRVGGAGRRLSPTPSAEVVLVECIRSGRRPSPTLISRALAEAQCAGHDELADAIVCTYIRPVVEAAEGRPPWPTTASPWPAEAPPYYAPSTYAPGRPPYAPDPRFPPGGVFATPAPGPEPGYAPYPSSYPSAPAPLPDPTSPAFQVPGQVPESAFPVPGQAPAPFGAPPWEARPGSDASTIPLESDASDDDILRMIAHLTTPPTQEMMPAASTFDPTLPPSGGASTGTGTVTVSGRSSPIDGVGTLEWSRFCDRVSRELPTYTTPHHVGQFRQRRERLRELGIDPETVVASPEIQRAAFDRDMGEAYRRAHASGLLACVGGAVEVPTTDGPPQVVQVTTSGVLGVVQAAGIDGAVGWFRSPEDRRRFSGTTAVFARANGVF